MKAVEIMVVTNRTGKTTYAKRCKIWIDLEHCMMGLHDSRGRPLNDAEMVEIYENLILNRYLVPNGDDWNCGAEKRRVSEPV